MLRSLKSMTKFEIEATDGTFGTVSDFLFDDESWTVRYLVADTGKWLPGRKVLIAPSALDQPTWELETLPVTLTRKQIENGPDLGDNRPVSRQHQIDLYQYFGWPPYFQPTGYFTPPTPPPPPSLFSKEEQEELNEGADPHLRSMREVDGYHIEATDGDIGHVEDFIVDDEQWRIRYLVVDTRNWLPGGRKVLVPSLFIDHLSWSEMKVKVDKDQETIKNSPPYDPDALLNRDEEHHE